MFEAIIGNSTFWKTVLAHLLTMANSIDNIDRLLNIYCKLVAQCSNAYCKVIHHRCVSINSVNFSVSGTYPLYHSTNR